MTDLVPIRRALLSVSEKAGLEPLAAALVARGVELVSTGGTATALRALGHAVKDVAELTGSPEMMDGRVKTLHPRVHGGLLALRDNADHVQAMTENGIGAIDLAVINLYPFAATVAKGAPRGHHWRWSDLRPMIDDAIAVTSTENAERRVLALTT